MAWIEFRVFFIRDTFLIRFAVFEILSVWGKIFSKNAQYLENGDSDQESVQNKKDVEVNSTSFLFVTLFDPSRRFRYIERFFADVQQLIFQKTLNISKTANRIKKVSRIKKARNTISYRVCELNFKFFMFLPTPRMPKFGGHFGQIGSKCRKNT